MSWWVSKKDNWWLMPCFYMHRIGYRSTASSVGDWCLINVNLRFSCVWNVTDFRVKVTKIELHFLQVREMPHNFEVCIESVWTSSWNCVIAVICIIAVIENAIMKLFSLTNLACQGLSIWMEYDSFAKMWCSTKQRLSKCKLPGAGGNEWYCPGYL